MHEVVNEQHAQESIEALMGDITLKHAATVLEEIGKRDALGKLLYQDLSGSEFEVWERKPGCGARLKVLAEPSEVGRLDAEIEL